MDRGKRFIRKKKLGQTRLALHRPLYNGTEKSKDKYEQ